MVGRMHSALPLTTTHRNPDLHTASSARLLPPAPPEVAAARWRRWLRALRHPLGTAPLPPAGEGAAKTAPDKPAPDPASWVDLPPWRPFSPRF